MKNHLLNLSALFEDDFCIDWIIELTGAKPSDTLRIFEEFIEAGHLSRKQPGIYRFSRAMRSKQLKLFSTEEQVSYHQRIVKIITREKLEDHQKAKLLSYHLLQVPNDITGCSLLKTAGDLFLDKCDRGQAIKCYLKVIKDLPASNFTEQSADLFIETSLQYAKISFARQQTSEVLSILNDALQVAQKYGKASYQALLKMNMAKNEWLCSRTEEAMKHFDEGQFIAEQLGDEHLLRKTNKFYTFFYFWSGHYKKVVNSYEKYVPEIMQFPEGRFPLYGVFMTGLCYAQTGQLSQGLGILDALRRHCREIGDHYMESYAVCGIGVMMLDILKYEEALQYLERGLKMSIRENNGWMSILSRLCLAKCYLLNGEYKKSAKFLETFVALSTQIQINSWPHPYFMEICWAIEEGILPELPGISLDKEIDRVMMTKNAYLQGVAHKHRALLDRKKGANHKTIMKSLNRSLNILRDSGCIVEMSKTQLEIARQYLLAGNEELARQAVISAAKILSPLNEGFIPPDLRYLITNEDHSVRFLLNEILTLGQEIANIRDSRELVIRIISSVNRLTGAERGALFLYDGSKLSIKGSENLSPEEISSSIFTPSMKIIQEVANTGVGITKIMNNDKNNIPLTTKAMVRAIICVPMILRNQLIGVLYHDNRLLGSAFEQSDLNLLAYFAAEAAIALDNVTTFENIQKENLILIKEKEYFEEQYRFTNISFENIIGESASIKEVIQQIKQVAQSDSNVLILGDTGVGKELVASAIHNYSPRRERPFICVQCSSLPYNLLPSELFGHEKGAFTGALKRRIGRFELADNGTIFLDEIGDLHHDIQVQLLRVLETKKFERIGGSETVKPDFRLIAATNRDLKNLVEVGTFRSDLYYRLNVFPIRVPSLYERKDDIPLLVQHFLRLYSKKLGKSFGNVKTEDINMLCEYDWPGNIRELENIVERAVILNRGPVLSFAGLLPNGQDSEISGYDNFMTLRNNERRHIIKALQKTNWKLRGPGGAAELLEINCSTLAFRMKKLGIARPVSRSKKGEIIRLKSLA